jgi:CheY-like chemotaxis protein
MIASQDGDDNLRALVAHLPEIRAHARLLTSAGEAGAETALRRLIDDIEDPAPFDGPFSPRIALFRGFYKHLLDGRTQAVTGPLGASATARAAFLLCDVEGFSATDMTLVLGGEPARLARQAGDVRATLAAHGPLNVLIIEDEFLIAADLEAILGAQGHTVVGVADTMDVAVDIGLERRPDLILADIQLADGSSGIEAVRTLTDGLTETAVIYISGNGEALLREGPDGDFGLIPKPFTEADVRAAVSRAINLQKLRAAHA